MFQCLYFKERDPQTDPRCTADAIIYAVKNDGVLVFVPESVSSPHSHETVQRAALLHSIVQVILVRRSHGVACSFHRYGVKGPVYLKNREGQVVSVGQDGTCEWKSGSIQQHSDHISSSSGGSAATFRLFDHITVSHSSSVAFSTITAVVSRY